jgi:hypothetical protein
LHLPLAMESNIDLFIQRKSPNHFNVFRAKMKGGKPKASEHNKYKMNCVAFYFVFSTIKKINLCW